MAFLIATTVTIGALSDLNGKNYIPNAPIEIRARNTNGSSGALSTIFSDQAGANPITQVGATANASGQFSFFAEAGPYNAVYNDGVQVVTIPLDIGGATVSKKIPITVIQDQLTYAYPSTVVGVTNVLVSGNTLHETEVAYVDDPIAKTITLSEGLSSGEIMEWWANSIPSTESGASTGINSFANAATAAAQLLGSLSAFTTLSGITAGDEFGGTFGRTGIVTIGKAGTVEVETASVYDGIGIQFTLVGNKIRLETLGVSYSNAAADTLSKIIALRTTGFNVDVSPRYNLTVFNGQNIVGRGQKEYIMHRSFAKLVPENTLLGWSMGWNRTNGLNTAMEVDVQISSDGIPVCFHNLSVDSTTNGSGEVKNLTLAQLKALKFTETIGTEFEDNVTIPTFDQFLEFASYVGAKIYPEIKGFRTDADIELMNDVIRKYRYENMTTFSAFPLSSLEKLREFNQQSAWAWATAAGVYTQGDLDRLSVLGGIGNVWQSLNEWEANPADVDVFHSYGWDVAAFTVTRVEHVQDMARLGIHKLHCDINPQPSASLSAIPTQRRFNLQPWSEAKTGSGTIIYTANPENAQTAGEVVTCEAGTSEDARVRLPFSISAGETIMMTVFARNIGTHASNAQIDIDRDVGTRIETLNIIGTDYIEYMVSMQAPFNERFAAYQGGFVLGSTFSRDSGAKFYRPIIRSSDSLFGAPRVLMEGLLIIAEGGVAGVHVLSDITNNNNVDIEGSGAAGDNINIKPQTELELTTVFEKAAAKGHITPTATGQTTLPLLFSADVQGGTGALILSAINSTTGAVVNLNTITSEHKIYFEVNL